MKKVTNSDTRGEEGLKLGIFEVTSFLNGPLNIVWKKNFMQFISGLQGGILKCIAPI